MNTRGVAYLPRFITYQCGSSPPPRFVYTLDTAHLHYFESLNFFSQLPRGSQYLLAFVEHPRTFWVIATCLTRVHSRQDERPQASEVRCLIVQVDNNADHSDSVDYRRFPQLEQGEIFSLQDAFNRLDVEDRGYLDESTAIKAAQQSERQPYDVVRAALKDVELDSSRRVELEDYVDVIPLPLTSFPPPPPSLLVLIPQ
jgi:hypothetical protein